MLLTPMPLMLPSLSSASGSSSMRRLFSVAFAHLAGADSGSPIAPREKVEDSRLSRDSSSSSSPLKNLIFGLKVS